MNKLLRECLVMGLVTGIVPLLYSPVNASRVVKIVIDDAIHPITEEYIGRSIQKADEQHADAVLIELRTPGGLVDSTRTIVSEIIASRAPVIVYVTPTGSTAASAGFFILESADVAAMAPGTNTGAAHPVLLGRTMDPVMKEKVENDLAAFMRSFSGKRGRNVEIAESAVRQSKSFTDQEALAQHVVDYVAKDEEDLFRQLEGKTIRRFDGGSTVLHLSGASVVFLPMTLKQKILAFILDPNIAFIIFSIGMLAIYAEFNHPGAVIPGVVGLIFVLLAIFAFGLLPTRFAALSLVLLAFVLFGLEAKFMTHGILGVGGIVSMVLGALLLVDGPIPEMRIKLLTALGVAVPFGAITIFLMTIAIRARRNKITTGIQGMIGATGIARGALCLEGKVFIHGETWNATSNIPVETGAEVRVNSVEGLNLHVEPVLKS